MPRKRVTAADVAREAGLSRATVGFVLNDTPGQTIPEATRQRVLRAAEELGYHPHPAARALARGHSNLVLLLLPDWPLGYSLSRNLEEASQALDAQGLTLVTQTVRARSAARPLWETLLPDVVMGLLPFTSEEVARIRAAGVPTVIPDGSGTEFPMEELTFTRAPAMQVDHLLDSGVDRLVWVHPDDPRLGALAADRLATARARAAYLGRDLETLTLHEDGPEDPVVAPRAGERVGVVAYNDEVAARVVGSALRAGIDVPGRLAVVGHDDAPIASLFVPSLTTVRVDVTGLGKLMAALATHAILGTPAPTAGPESKAELIIRESA